jgi:hypothetical protein
MQQPQPKQNQKHKPTQKNTKTHNQKEVVVLSKLSLLHQEKNSSRTYNPSQQIQSLNGFNTTIFSGRRKTPWQTTQ